VRTTQQSGSRFARQSERTEAIEQWLHDQVGPAYDALVDDRSRASSPDQWPPRAGHLHSATARYHIVFSPEAHDQLTHLEDYLTSLASSAVADRYIDAIVRRCEGLSDFPYVGTDREDVRPGLRTLDYRQRITVAFAISLVPMSIIGFFYGGRGYAALVAASRVVPLAQPTDYHLDMPDLTHHLDDNLTSDDLNHLNPDWHG